MGFGSLFGCGSGFNNGCFGNSFFGGSWIWIIILLFLCNGEFFDGFGCGCGCKRRKRRDCGCGFGDNWWIWIIILFFFCCCQGSRQICIPQNDDCC